MRKSTCILWGLRKLLNTTKKCFKHLPQRGLIKQFNVAWDEANSSLTRFTPALESLWSYSMPLMMGRWYQNLKHHNDNRVKGIMLEMKYGTQAAKSVVPQRKQPKPM